MGHKARQPSHQRYNSRGGSHKNKLKRAKKLLARLEKFSPGKHTLIGHQVVRTDREYKIRDTKDRLDNNIKRIVCKKENEERMENRLERARRKKFENKREKYQEKKGQWFKIMKTRKRRQV